MNTGSGFSIQIFLPSGEPEGLRIIEMPNWTGQGIVFPRSRLAEAHKREELKRPGVYVLWGPGEDDELPRVYVGEGDTVLSRLDNHAKNKDFWTHAVAFTSKDKNFNKVHFKHLESRLVKLAREAKRAELKNDNKPQPPAVSEADSADAERFLANLLLCLPIVGIKMFEKVAVDQSKDDLLLRIKGKGIEARGLDTAQGFVVQAGSQTVKQEVPSIHPYLHTRRKLLIDLGVLEDAGGFYRFKQDYLFDSPSMAAGVILGRSSNGRDEWKDADGHTLKELQELAV